MIALLTWVRLDGDDAVLAVAHAADSPGAGWERCPMVTVTRGWRREGVVWLPGPEPADAGEAAGPEDPA